MLKWVLVGVAVLWFLMEREKASVKIAANKGATDVTNAAGRGVVKVVDEAASALGRWFGGLFGDDKPTNSGSSTGSSAASSPDYWDDQFGSGQDYGTGE
jgi:hypothetical protein